MMLALHPPGDYVSDVIRDTGTWYERDILSALAEVVDGGVIVDAGAMIGNHTVFFAQMVAHTEIHAFEPWPENLTLLRQNVAPYPSVTVHPVALSNTQRTLHMVSEPANRGHSRVEGEGTVVEAIPLDDLHLEHVSLLKIDVEGHEPEVLAGAQDTIERCWPFIVIEDWKQLYGKLLPGYEMIREWGLKHQTYLYAPA